MAAQEPSPPPHSLMDPQALYVGANKFTSTGKEAIKAATAKRSIQCNFSTTHTTPHGAV